MTVMPAIELVECGARRFEEVDLPTPQNSGCPKVVELVNQVESERLLEMLQMKSYLPTVTMQMWQWRCCYP